MPKKISTNPKSIEARARKEEKKKADNEKKEREMEDAKWQDDDKLIQRKAEKKAAEERKRQQQLEAKLLKQSLYEQEMGPEKKESNVKKLTRAEIQAQKEKEEKERLKMKNVATESSEVTLLSENVNHLHVDSEIATTVDEALAILNENPEPLDLHPEKRVKAAYAAFEEKHLPTYKMENPNMRLSQLKQMIRKDWNKSPENPLNRPHRTFKTS